MWPRHRPVMPTGRKPANIPTQRRGAVGRLAVHGEEEVTNIDLTLSWPSTSWLGHRVLRDPRRASSFSWVSEGE